MYREEIRLLSTSTAGKLAWALIIASLAVLASGPRPASAHEATGVAAEVKQLGWATDNVQIVKALARKPELSAKLLIQELHPVEDKRILASENRPATEHVLWCIRALRFLTGGKDFCGNTNHKFGKSQAERDRKYWLYFRHKSCLSFFAMWPSRGSEYIAPKDAQEQIINKWRRWFARKGSFKYKPLQNPTPDKWLW